LESGVPLYIDCPDFGPLVIAFAVDDGPSRAIYQGCLLNYEYHQELVAALRAGHIIVAHNIDFDYRVYQKIRRVFGWPDVPIEQWSCTQTAAYMAGLPGKLDHVTKALDIGHKMKSGANLITLYCKPRVDGSFSNSPLRLFEFAAYAAHDVELCREVALRLPAQMKLQQSPLERWARRVDLAMNELGLPVDLRAVNAAIGLSGGMKTVLDNTLARLTEGRITTVGQIDRILKLAQEFYPNVVSVNAESINTLISQRDCPAILRKVLLIRRAGGNASVNKYKAFKTRLQLDGRVRCTLRHYGAFTGRWAGRGVQTQNMPKGLIAGFKNDTLAESLHTTLALPKGVPWGKGLSAAIRGVILAPEGQALLVSDYNAIECRVLAWLSGQHDMLATFQAGGDVYIPMAAKILKKTVEEVTRSERDRIGKATILGCGYGMGATRFAAENKVSIEMAVSAVSSYRHENAHIPRLWKGLEKAATQAVLSHGQWYHCGLISYIRVGDFLECHLPSGRPLFYYKPTVCRSDKWGTGDTSPQLHYINKENTGLVKKSTWGGSLVENVCQAIARDLIVQGLINLHSEGFKTILQVHDEVVVLVAEAEGNTLMGAVESCLTRQPPVYAGLPLKVESWTGKRYRK